MLPINPWEHQNAVKSLYSKCVGTVCIKHQITRMELDILLFLANNPRFDTAADMVEIRYLSKSQVSVSVKELEEHGYIRKEYENRNRKTAHLKVCKKAEEIIRDGQGAQEKFLQIMLKGFSREEIGIMRKYNERILGNLNTYLKEDME